MDIVSSSEIIISDTRGEPDELSESIEPIKPIESIESIKPTESNDDNFKFLRPRRLVMVVAKCDVCNSTADTRSIPYNDILNGWIICENSKCKEHVEKSHAIVQEVANLYISSLFGFSSDYGTLIKIPRSDGTTSMGNIRTGIEDQVSLHEDGVYMRVEFDVNNDKLIKSVEMIALLELNNMDPTPITQEMWTRINQTADKFVNKYEYDKDTFTQLIKLYAKYVKD